MVEKTELIYEDLTYKIRKSVFNVYNTLGPGLREETYKQALILDFQHENISFLSEKPYPIYFRDKIIDEYRVDLIVFDKLILELKAVAEMHPRFEAQLLSYLKVAQLKLGLLVNFGSDKVFIKRIINPHYDKKK